MHLPSSLAAGTIAYYIGIARFGEERFFVSRRGSFQWCRYREIEVAPMHRSLALLRGEIATGTVHPSPCCIYVEYVPGELKGAFPESAPVCTRLAAGSYLQVSMTPQKAAAHLPLDFSASPIRFPPPATHTILAATLFRNHPIRDLGGGV